MRKHSFNKLFVILLLFVIYQFSFMLYQAIMRFDWGTFGSNFIAFFITFSGFFIILKLKKSEQ